MAQDGQPESSTAQQGGSSFAPSVSPTPSTGSRQTRGLGRGRGRGKGRATLSQEPSAPTARPIAEELASLRSLVESLAHMV